MPTSNAGRPNGAPLTAERCGVRRLRGFVAAIGVVAALLALVGVSGPQPACDMAAAKGPPPFTRAQNVDGARFVWMALGEAGFPYEYVPISAFPRHPRFRLVGTDAAHAGDVAWWPAFAGIYAGREPALVVAADGELPVATLVQRYGPVRFYREVIPADVASFDTMGRRRTTGAAPKVATFLLPSAVRVDVPCGWRLLEESENDSIASLVLNVPNAPIDSGANHTNILIVAYRRTPGKDFRALTDTLFALLGQGTGRVIILADTMLDASTRFMFWRGEKGGSPYSVYDAFGRKGAVTVQVRVAIPVAAARVAWMEHFSGDVERLLAGVRVQQTALFLGWAARPSLSKFRP